MGAIGFSGLASGLDTAAIVDQLVYLERAPIRRLERDQADFRSRISLYDRFADQLEALQTAAQALDTSAEALPVAATSSDDAVLTAVADGAPPQGSFSLKVDSLAKATKIFSDQVAARDQTGVLGTGTITVTVGSGSPTDFTVDGTTTLDSLVQSINSADLGVTALVVSDGIGYRMLLIGDDTGAQSDVTVADSGTLLNVAAAANKVQTASDAQVTVDGLVTATSTTNTFSGLIEGLTITVHQAQELADSAVDLTLAPDADTMLERVQALVDAYNTFNADASAQFAYAGVAKGSNSLVGDSALRNALSDIHAAVLNPIDIDPPNSDDWALAFLGVEGSETNTLSIDSDQLEAAMNATPEEVQKLFAGVLGSFEGLAKRIDDAVERYVDSIDGVFSLRKEGLTDRIDTAEDQIERLERRVETYEERLRAEFIVMEQILSQLQTQSGFLASIGLPITGV